MLGNQPLPNKGDGRRAEFPWPPAERTVKATQSYKESKPQASGKPGRRDSCRKAYPTKKVASQGPECSNAQERLRGPHPTAHAYRTHSICKMPA